MASQDVAVSALPAAAGVAPSHPPQPTPRKRHAAWIVLVVGLLLAAGVTLYVKSTVDEAARQEFTARCDDIRTAIADRMDAHAAILLSGAAFFETSERVTREDWRVFTQHLNVDQRLPGIQGMGFALLIQPAALPRHIEEIRSEGFPQYTVRPEGERDVYSSIIYLEPFSGRNLRAFGYDMLSEPVRRTAMERARDTDHPALSGKVVLVQETSKDVQAGTLMYVPVYRKGMPTDSTEQRRAAVYGWVYSPYRMDDLMQGVLSSRGLTRGQQIRLQIYDGDQPSAQSLLHASPAAGDNRPAPGVRFTRQMMLDFNGHSWTVCCTQAAGGTFAAARSQVGFTALGSTLIALLLFSLVRVLENTGVAAERRAEELSRGLRESERRHRIIVQTAMDGFWQADAQGRLLAVNETYCRMSGFSEAELLAMRIPDLSVIETADSLTAHVAKIMAQGEARFESRHRRKDGTLYDVEVSVQSQPAVGGQLVVFLRDITQRKQAEEALRESEANFRTFFETMTDMIVAGTPDGRLLYCNPAVTRTLGYTADELREMPLLDLHPPDRRQEAEGIFAAMFRGERETCPLPMVSRSGALVAVETRVWFGTWNGAPCIFGVSKDLAQEAKQLFERLFRNNPSLVALSTLPEGRFIDVNDAFLRTLGYAREHIIGKTPAELGLFVTSDALAAALADLQETGYSSGTELQVRRRDGAILDGLFSSDEVSSQGKRYLLSVMVDITQRKRAEAELGRLSVIQGELVRLATKFVNVPVERQDTAVDQSLASMGRLIKADRAYLYAYDFANGTMSNTHEWCAPGVLGTMEHTQSVPIAQLTEWVDLHQRGEAVHIPSTAALPAASPQRQLLESRGLRSLITLPLLLEGTCLGFVGFDAIQAERAWQQEEVSLLRVLARLYAHFETRRAIERETRELQKRLAQARDAAQEAARAKGLFLANMSHEIRTPLNAILGYAQIMERDCRACPAGERLHAITRSGEHLLQLITGLLELVRSDTRAIPLVPSEFDLPRVLEDVRLMFAQQTAAQGVTLAVSSAPDAPRFIYADQGKIRQVLANLVGNALKFTERGSVSLSASILAGGTASEVTLAVEVADTGCGIRADELERIFDVFYLAESGRKTGKGTGLGLPLSRRYARALGGDVTVTSRLGEGSTFRFTFVARTAPGAAEAQQRKGVLRLVPGQRAWRILVVDDDPMSRSMLTAMLQPVGFAVEAVTSATEALERLCQPPQIGLVLLDKNMPEMDGYTAVGHIRKLPGGSEIRVVIVTAVGFATEEAQALAAGADGYVAKPVRRKTLMAEIARVTDLRYDYDEAPVAVPAVSAPTVLTPEALSRLPAEQQQALDEALRRGDIRQLRDLVETIARADAGLAAGMRVLVDAYDYDHLQRLLKAAKGGAL